MFRLSKKTEYALLALQKLAQNEDNLISVKELATELGISFEFLSKTMQRLAKKGLVQSQQGIKGGYHLSKPADDIKLMEVINSLNENVSIVDCFSVENEENDCNRGSDCTIKHHLFLIQQKIDDIFLTTTINDLAKNSEIKNIKVSNNLVLSDNFIEIK